MKDAAEVAALRAAAHAVDAVAAEMRDRPFGGRTEIDVSRELVDRMLAHGHDRPNFAIVGSGPNGASPHHDAGARVIGDGDVVVCDFGGTMAGYCSDITRMFVVGEPAAEVADTYAALAAAQELAVRAATVGTTCEDVDAVARRALAADGLADAFIHRIGHGIGLDAHEDPYLVAGNADAARARARVQHRAGRLLPRPVRDAPRGHRGRRPVRARPAQRAPRGTSPWSPDAGRGRRLTCTSTRRRSCCSGPRAGSRSSGSRRAAGS